MGRFDHIEIGILDRRKKGIFASIKMVVFAD
jgi:hypothetical protein